jgi:hypothetical protein
MKNEKRYGVGNGEGKRGWIHAKYVFMHTYACMKSL